MIKMSALDDADDDQKGISTDCRGQRFLGKRRSLKVSKKALGARVASCN